MIDVVPYPAQPSPQLAREILSVADLTVRFGGVTAVNRVSIRVLMGQVCAFIGPNGAGKTTLFDAVAGQNQPLAGTIRYDGTDITTKSALWRSRHGIRRTYQRQQTFPGLTVEDNVVIALEAASTRPLADLLGHPGRRRDERANREIAGEILSSLGLYEQRKEAAYKLPLGRARLLELGRAIAGRPRLLLLDEPTSGMEQRDLEHLSKALDDIIQSHTCGVLLVEHDVQFAMERADHVFAMHLGEIIAQGTPAEVQGDQRVVEVYLGDSVVAADYMTEPHREEGRQL